MKRTALILVLAVFCTGGAIHAQFVDYNSPGDFRSPAESRADTLDRAMESARWKVGRVLVNPWFGLRNIGYTETETTQGDGDRDPELNISIGAGLDGYLPIGSRFVIGGYARPEYTWWEDSSDRNRVNGRAGLGAFGNFGRVGLDLSARRVEQIEIFSREFEEQVNRRTDEAEGLVTFDLGKGVGWFAGGLVREVESIEEELLISPALSGLDRRETSVKTGFVFTLAEDVRLAVGVEETEAEFESLDQDRSNTGDAQFAELDYDGPVFTALARVAFREIEPSDVNSEFVDFDGETGSLNLGWRPAGPLRLELFARRNLGFALGEDFAFSENEINGVAVRFALADAASIRIFAEDGTLEFEPIDPLIEGRFDDLSGYGVSVSFELGRALVRLGGSETEYDSNLPGFDRTVTRVGVNVDLGLFGDNRSGPWD